MSNSKAKKYHGSSEHMNELPTMEEQAKSYLLQEPSPFLHYNESKKEFLPENDPKWKEAVCKKFDWVTILLKNHAAKYTPSTLALHSDQQNFEEKVENWR